MADVLDKINRILPPADSCHDYRGDVRGINIDFILNNVFYKQLHKLHKNQLTFCSWMPQFFV